MTAIPRSSSSFVRSTSCLNILIRYLEKLRNKRVRLRSSGMEMKRLRLVFYLLATVELVLVTLAWVRLPLH